MRSEAGLQALLMYGFPGLIETLDRFFIDIAPLDPGDGVLIAFSGGPDSTALLHAMARLAAQRRFELVAAHLDHGLDADSARRAERAAGLASSLAVPLLSERLGPPLDSTRGQEDWARRQRYAFLERCRDRLGARWIATAHHRDDQIETVLLRILLGSGLEGLAAMEPRREAIVRPLLSLGRREIEAALAASGLEPLDDPTNRDLRRPRNLVRGHLLPRLSEGDARIGERLISVSAASRSLGWRLAPRLKEALDLRPSPPAEPIATIGAGEHRTFSVDLAALRALDATLLPFALSLLHRSAGIRYPPGAASRGELQRQLAATARIGCDCGSGWRWREVGGRLELARVVTSIAPFTYTLEVPGEVAIPELGLRVSVGREPVASWMFEGHPTRTALALPLGGGDLLTIRNRLPGDRIQPLGFSHHKRLKEILIDRNIAKQQRDRIPLLCLDDRIAWIPGLMIDESCRVTTETHPWVARIESL